MCDPSKPYADTALVTLTLDKPVSSKAVTLLHRVGASVGGARPGRGEPQAGVGTMGEVSEVGLGGGGEDRECYLVVKTEQTTWHAPHPTPYTPHPTSYTLHPTPYTYTLHPRSPRAQPSGTQSSLDLREDQSSLDCLM